MDLILSESFEIKKTRQKIIAEKIFDFIQARQRFLLYKEDRRMDVLDAVLGSGCGSLAGY